MDLKLCEVLAEKLLLVVLAGSLEAALELIPADQELLEACQCSLPQPPVIVFQGCHVLSFLVEGTHPASQGLRANSFQPDEVHLVALTTEQDLARQGLHAWNQQMALPVGLSLSNVEHLRAPMPGQQSPPHQMLQVLLVLLGTQLLDPSVLYHELLVQSQLLDCSLNGEDVDPLL